MRICSFADKHIPVNYLYKALPFVFCNHAVVAHKKADAENHQRRNQNQEGGRGLSLGRTSLRPTLSNGAHGHPALPRNTPNCSSYLINALTMIATTDTSKQVTSKLDYAQAGMYFICFGAVFSSNIFIIPIDTASLISLDICAEAVSSRPKR